MTKTFTFVTDAIGLPEPVTAQTHSTRITVGENGQVGTADFWVYGNENGSPSAVPVIYAAGKKITFTAGTINFKPGQIVAYVAASTGTLTMSQEEEQ